MIRSLMVTLRAVLARGGVQAKADLVRLCARELGHARAWPLNLKAPFAVQYDVALPLTRAAHSAWLGDR